MIDKTETVTVAKANEEGDFKMDVEEIKKWKVKSRTNLGMVVFITTEEDGTYSLSRDEYDEIINKNK